MSPISFAIIAADRPQLLPNCIASYLTSRSTPSDVILMDDSRHPSEIPAACTRIATRTERQTYIEHLVKAGISPHTASYALLGLEGEWFTAGANRNALLLDTIGEKLLMVDDDTLGRTSTHPEATSALRSTGREDPTDIRFFATRNEAMAAAHWNHIDLFEENARCLRDEIGLVSHGVVGDSGFYSPAHLLWLTSPETRERLRPSDDTLRLAMSSREVIRIAPQPSITRGAVCMATALGLDNRVGLPPFLPVCRNEDGFFGNLLNRCMPDAAVLHLPHAIVHAPSGEKYYQRRPADPQQLRFSELIILLLSVCPATTLPALGEHLRTLTRSPQHFPGAAREIVAAARRSLLHRIETQWGDFTGFSPLWIETANTFRTRMNELIDSPDCWIPTDLPPDAGLISSIVALTGDLLCAWPDIVETARNLRTKGVRISRTTRTRSPKLAM